MDLASKPWTPTRLCNCCGRAIVLLRLPAWGSKDDPRWFVACYAKGWDYNPWYVKGTHHRHPPKRYATRMAQMTEPTDPFFTL